MKKIHFGMLGIALVGVLSIELIVHLQIKP